MNTLTRGLTRIQTVGGLKADWHLSMSGLITSGKAGAFMRTADNATE